MEEGDWNRERKREYREGVDWTKGTVLGTGAYSTCYQVSPRDWCLLHLLPGQF
jgi:hypothetical protein